MYRVIANGEVWRGEFCNQAKSGRLYWVDTTIIPRARRRGKVIGYTSIRVDITPRKTDGRGAAAQRSSSLRSTMMALGDGIVVQDRDRRIIACNPAAQRMLGLSGDPPGSTSLSTRAGARSGRTARLSARRPSGHGHAGHRRAAARRGDGIAQARRPVTWISINSVAILGRRRQAAVGRHFVFRYHRAAQAKEILTEAIAAIPDGFVVFDREDRLIACNDAYREIYGVSPPRSDRASPSGIMLLYGLQNGQYPKPATTSADRRIWLPNVWRSPPRRRRIDPAIDRRPLGAGPRTADPERLHRRLPHRRHRGQARNRAAARGDRQFSGRHLAVSTPISIWSPATMRSERCSGCPTLCSSTACRRSRRSFAPMPSAANTAPATSNSRSATGIALARRNQPHLVEQVRPNGTVLEIRASRCRAAASSPPSSTSPTAMPRSGCAAKASRPPGKWPQAAGDAGSHEPGTVDVRRRRSPDRLERSIRRDLPACTPDLLRPGTARQGDVGPSAADRLLRDRPARIGGRRLAAGQTVDRQSPRSTTGASSRWSTRP